MTSPAAIFLIFTLLTAFLVGYRAPAAPETPLTVTRFPRSAATPLTRPNAEAETVLADLRIDLTASGSQVVAQGGDEPVGPPPEEVPAPQPPPPPPAPDVALVFRHRLTAIVDQGPTGLAALLSDPAGEGRATRLLRPGDVFSGRWRLTALTSSEAILQDGRRTRRVQFYDATGAPRP